MKPLGFNPMRWDCDTDGCFNVKRRPKIEMFADCFPRRINFGDVDGLVEIGGRFCLLEWKGQGGALRRGGHEDQGKPGEFLHNRSLLQVAVDNSLTFMGGTSPLLFESVYRRAGLLGYLRGGIDRQEAFSRRTGLLRCHPDQVAVIARENNG